MAVDRITGLPSIVSSVIVPTKAMSPAQLAVAPKGKLPMIDCAPITTWLYSASNFALRSVAQQLGGVADNAGAAVSRGLAGAGHRPPLARPHHRQGDDGEVVVGELGAGAGDELGQRRRQTVTGLTLRRVDDHGVGPQQRAAGLVGDGRDVVVAEDAVEHAARRRLVDPRGRLGGSPGRGSLRFGAMRPL